MFPERSRREPWLVIAHFGSFRLRSMTGSVSGEYYNKY